MCDCISLIYVSAVAPLIGRYCGTKIPPEIQSSSGLLSLSFHTDMAVAKDGFSARYNMTHKEVSDCECRTTWSVFFGGFFTLPVSRFVPPAFIPTSLPTLSFFVSRSSLPSRSLLLCLL